jgi:hypothetical protein
MPVPDAPRIASSPSSHLNNGVVLTSFEAPPRRCPATQDEDRIVLPEREPCAVDGAPESLDHRWYRLPAILGVLV